MLRVAGLSLLMTVGAQAQQTPPAQSAPAGERGEGMRRLQQLTVGVGDQFLGQLSPDGKTLIYVANQSTASEIFTQETDDGRPKVLFDEGAEVTWPRVSPDGSKLLYVSYSAHAAGQLCVRDFLSGDNRRCLEDNANALQAEWTQSGRIALLSRKTIEGDLQLREVTVGRSLEAKLLFERNLSGITLSPDGRWWVYLPIERYVTRVGPGFAARASSQLEAVRTDGKTPPIPLPVDLPGVTGHPAFSVDGKSLYVTQFIDDSNQDGVIDASDHGVLFKVPFPSQQDDAPLVAAKAEPIQLTDSAWNCQYPNPSKTELIATCTRRSNLAIYSLPLEGRVPPDWNAERLQLEADPSVRASDRLLLLRHWLTQETALPARRAVMMQLIRLHLRREEIDPAEFYARKVAAAKDKSTAGLGTGLRVLLEHRRAIYERKGGRMSLDLPVESEKRIEALKAKPSWSPAGAAFAQIVRSEIADAMGDKERARRELEAVKIDDVSMPSVIQAYFDRAEDLYRELDDREALAQVSRRLAVHPSLDADARLPYARAAMQTLSRGIAYGAAGDALSKESAEGELGFARDLEGVLLKVTDGKPSAETLDAVSALYRAQTRPSRRRQVVLDVAQRASEVGAESVLEVLVTQYVDDVKPGTDERRRAELLYQRVMLGRAYRELGARELEQARADFEAVGRKTGNLEAFMGAINVEGRMGKTPDAIALRFADVKPPVTAHFVSAYLVSRELPRLKGAEHKKAVAAGIASLRKGWGTLKARAEARALRGYFLHERFLEEDDRAAAQRANVHYLIALDLVRQNLRLKAMVLGQLALLQAEVGNYRIALGFLDDREKLPYADNGAGLAVRLARARTLFHVGRDADAAKVAQEGLSLIERKERLAEYRVLALDQAALYNLSAGRAADALQLYDQELALLGPTPGIHNEVTVNLGHAAAALGSGHPERALADLTGIDARLSVPRLPPELAWPHGSDEEVLRTYRLIAAGLRANAHFARNELKEAVAALGTRQKLLQARLDDAPNVTEAQRALTLVETRLADAARQRGDPLQAGLWLARALAHADAVQKESDTPIDRDQLIVLRLAAEVQNELHPRLPFDLRGRLRQAQEILVKERDPAHRAHLRWIEAYLSAS